MRARASRVPCADRADCDVDIVVNHDYAVRRFLIFSHKFPDRLAGKVHIRFGFCKDDAFPVHVRNGGFCLALGMRKPDAQLFREFAHDVETHVVICVFIGKSFVAKTDNNHFSPCMSLSFLRFFLKYSERSAAHSSFKMPPSTWSL